MTTVSALLEALYAERKARYGPHPDSYQEGFLDGVDIARGVVENAELAAPPSVADTHVLVPMEPTTAMLKVCLERYGMKWAMTWMVWETLLAAAPAASAYEARNPLGGPATMFEAIASRLRAGEEYWSVMADYGISFAAPPATPSTPGT